MKNILLISLILMLTGCMRYKETLREISTLYCEDRDSTLLEHVWYSEHTTIAGLTKFNVSSVCMDDKKFSYIAYVYENGKIEKIKEWTE